MTFMGVTVRCANCSQEIEIFGISNISLDIEIFPSLCVCIRNALIAELEIMVGEEE
jgi:ATP phosphoribosyltransferase regulatory subunit HisZ